MWTCGLGLQVEAYDTDELIYHGGVRISFGMQLMEAANRIQRHLPDITWPFLLLHGDADKLCDIRGSQLMYDQAKSSDKTLKVRGNLQVCFMDSKYAFSSDSKLECVCLLW